jgi:DNA gyrase subunit A
MEEMERGKNRIIVTELPYMVNKASLIERIAELVRDGNLDGVVDLRDESDRQGLRVVIELSKTVNPEDILRKLYKHTPMQTTFGINLLALVGGEPRLLTLKQALKVFLDHRLEVIKRRSEYDLEKARQRAHILEGYRIALRNLDEIIALIRNSPDADEAKVRLMKRYKLSDIQAQAILDMPLRRLAALERKKIEDEYREVMAKIAELEGLLKSAKKIRELCAAELMEARQAFAEKRKTQIIGLKEGDSISKMLTITDVTPSQTVLIGINESGMIARTAQESTGWITGKDAPLWLIRTDTHQTLYLASISGKAAAIPVHAIPEAPNVAEGVPLHKVSPLSEDDPLGAIFCLPSKRQVENDQFIMTITRGGMVKKTSIQELPGPSATTFALCKVNDGDSLGWTLITDGSQEVIFATTKGMCIRFKEEEVRPMGLVAAGVNGMKLAVGDELVGADVVKPTSPVVLLCTDGKGKRVAIQDFPVQGRYGQGVIGWKTKPGVHISGMWVQRGNEPFIIHFLKSASRMKKPEEFVLGTRAIQGKEVIDVKPGDQAIGMTGIDIALNGSSVEPDSTPLMKGKSRSISKPGSTQKVKATSSSARGKTAKSGVTRKAKSDLTTSAKTGKSKPGSKPAVKKVVATGKSRSVSRASTTETSATKRTSTQTKGKGSTTAKKPASAKPKTSPKVSPKASLKTKPKTSPENTTTSRAATAKKPPKQAPDQLPLDHLDD